MLKSSLAICLLLGQILASEELFLKDHSVNHMTLKDQITTLAADDQADDDKNKPQTVHGGACQYVAGSQIFDLSKLERKLAKEQNGAKLQPLQYDDPSGAFQYKICLPQWRLREDQDMQVGACQSSKKGSTKSGKKTAFMSEHKKDGGDSAVKD
jgi:hypothetical protein